jgi:transcription initiation factor TFIID subunit 15
MNERLIVQFAKGSRREPYHPHERPPPRPRRTPYKMTITGLPVETSWQVSMSPPRAECFGTSVGYL